MPTQEWFIEQFEALGASTKRAFDEAEERRAEMERRMIDRFDVIEADVRDLKRTSSQVVQSLGATDRQNIELEHRLRRIEKHLGFAV